MQIKIKKLMWNTISVYKYSKAHSKHRSTHVPNLTDELGTAGELRLNEFGSVG